MSDTEPNRKSPVPKPTKPVQVAGILLLALTPMGTSPQSMQFEQLMGELGAYYALPTSLRSGNRRSEHFRRLARQWRADTRFRSAPTELAMHPAYQSIIGMGSEALPLILEDLRDNSGYWYWALKSISSEDPVPPQDRGRIGVMKDAWLKWGRTKGLLSS